MSKVRREREDESVIVELPPGNIAEAEAPLGEAVGELERSVRDWTKDDSRLDDFTTIAVEIDPVVPEDSSDSARTLIAEDMTATASRSSQSEASCSQRKSDA